MVIDKTVMEAIHTLDPRTSADYDVAEIEGGECINITLGELEMGVGKRAYSVAEEAGEWKTSFVDIMGGMEREAGGESEGFTFANSLHGADLPSERLLESVVHMSQLPLC